MKKKRSLTEKISLAENNAVDFMHACVTIALHDEYEVGVQRLRKVNLRRDEINEEMLEVMAQPRKSGRGLWRRRERQAERVLPEGKLWRQAFELNKPFLFIIGVRGGRFGGLVYPLIL